MTALPPLILIIEAVELVRAALEGQLGARGYRMLVAASGEAALARVAVQRPDAILLARDLPGLSGAAVLDRLRADPELAAVPVIMLTQGGSREELLDALRRGAHDSLAAPFDAAELDARVMAALRVKALHDQLVEANRRLAEQAMSDDLTGLANRRHGVRELAREVALAVRHGQQLAVARIDVDHFKEINDTYGHQVGDEVLVEVARRLEGAIRGGDVLARWGGDEFVTILPATDRGGTVRAAERLRVAVAAAPVRAGGAEIAVTISVGWAHWVGDTPDDLLARADHALYAAKGAGRNAVHPAG